MSAKSTHVLKSISGGWGVQKSDAARASRVFDNQSSAIEHGRALAKREGTSLYIHREDGTIRSTSGNLSHGSTPSQAGALVSRSMSGHASHAGISTRLKRAAKKKK